MTSRNVGNVSVLEFEITDMEVDGVTAVVPDLPVDGSLFLAFVTLSPSVGVWTGVASPPDRLLIAYTGGRLAGKNVDFTDPGAPTGPLVPPTGWNFV